MSKTVNYKGRAIVLRDPNSMVFETAFHEGLYRHTHNAVTGLEYVPFVDVDSLADGSVGIDIMALADASNIKLKAKPSAKASNRDRLLIQFYVRHFLADFPKWLGCF